MILRDICLNPQYDTESDFCDRTGVYGDYDANVLYRVVREKKPAVILDFAPREGKSTSCILKACKKNMGENPSLKITYVISEMDPPFLESIKQYCQQYEGIQFYFYENIIDNLDAIKSVGQYDLLFIDANHDFVLANWYIDNLFPLLSDKDTAFIHVHDVNYDLHGNGWDDVGFQQSPQSHEDIVSLDRLKQLYSANTLYKYFYKWFKDESDSINLFEEDIVKDWFMNKQDRFVVESTITLCRMINLQQDMIRSCYFFAK
jgi:hypothetical protein